MNGIQNINESLQKNKDNLNQFQGSVGELANDFGAIPSRFNMTKEDDFKFIQPKSSNGTYICNVIMDDQQYFTNSKPTPAESNVDYMSSLAKVWMFKLAHISICSSCFCFIILLLCTLYSNKTGIIVLTILSVVFIILAIVSRSFYKSSYSDLSSKLTSDCVQNSTLIDPHAQRRDI